MVLFLASKTFQRIAATPRSVTTRTFAAASERVWKVYLSGMLFDCSIVGTALVLVVVCSFSAAITGTIAI